MGGCKENRSLAEISRDNGDRSSKMRYFICEDGGIQIGKIAY